MLKPMYIRIADNNHPRTHATRSFRIVSQPITDDSLRILYVARTPHTILTGGVAKQRDEEHGGGAAAQHPQHDSQQTSEKLYFLATVGIVAACVIA